MLKENVVCLENLDLLDLLETLDFKDLLVPLENQETQEKPGIQVEME